MGQLDPSGVLLCQEPFSPMSSESQIAANRQNAQCSTGPKTPEGKAKSSLNAVKTGLTGRTVLLPSDDAAAYEAHVARFVLNTSPRTKTNRRSCNPSLIPIGACSAFLLSRWAFTLSAGSNWLRIFRRSKTRKLAPL